MVLAQDYDCLPRRDPDAVGWDARARSGLRLGRNRLSSEKMCVVLRFRLLFCLIVFGSGIEEFPVHKRDMPRRKSVRY